MRVLTSQTCSHPILPTINTSLIPSHLSPPGHCRPNGIVSCPLCPLCLLCRLPTMPMDLEMRCLRMCPINGQGQDTDTAPTRPIHGSLSFSLGFTATTYPGVASVLYSIYYIILIRGRSLSQAPLLTSYSLNRIESTQERTHYIPLNSLHTPQSWVLPFRSCLTSSGERRR